MAKIIHTGGGMFVDTEPVAAPDGVEDDPDVHIYAFARLRSLEHVRFGLFRTEGGPEAEEIGAENVGAYGMEPIAQFWEFGEALRAVEEDSRRRVSAFEENPFVEVTTKKQYDEAIEALGIEGEDPSGWVDEGLYDFRDDPPSFQGSVEVYEQEEMKDAADQAIEFMFHGDDWEAAYRELAKEED